MAGRKTGSLPVMGRRASLAPSATSTGWKPVCHDSRAGLSSALVVCFPHDAYPPAQRQDFWSARSAISLPSRAERTMHPLPVDRARGMIFFNSLQSLLQRCALRLVATQSRGDGNGRLPHRHFTLRTTRCGKNKPKKA